MTTNTQTPAVDAPGDDRSGVFISYKHNRYRRQAEDLHRFLTTFSAPAWLDVKEISLPHQLPRQELEEVLRQAVANCRLLAFFETVDALEHDESVGDESKVSWNWQIYELQYGGEVIFISPRSSGLGVIYSPNSGEIPQMRFYNLPYLAYLLAIAAGAPTEELDSFWEENFALFPQTTASAYQIVKWHALTERLPLPELIDPTNTAARFNLIIGRTLPNRSEVRPDHRFSDDR